MVGLDTSAMEASLSSFASLRSIVASVIDVQAGRNWAHKVFVAQAMRVFPSFCFGDIEHAVATRNSSGPKQTSIRHSFGMFKKAGEFLVSHGNILSHSRSVGKTVKEITK
jgi:hypothetical protein